MKKISDLSSSENEAREIANNIQRGSPEFDDGWMACHDYYQKIVAEKDLVIRISEQHTQYWEDKCAE